MPSSKKHSHIATALFKQIVAEPKLAVGMPGGLVLTEQNALTKFVTHVTIGALGDRRTRQLERMGDAALLMLNQVKVLPVSEPPIPVAGLVAKKGDRFVVSGVEQDLGNLFLAAYLFRLTLLTRAEVRKFLEETNNKYIVGDTLFL